MQANIDPAHLSAYIASRICHDLVSSVSSITNALDFMNEPQDSEMRVQAEKLLHDGADSAASKLKFLRYAFGSAGLSKGAADIHEAKQITERFVASHNYKPTLTWDIETQHLSFSHARLIMNLVMLAVDCLPRGGTIAVKVRNQTDGLGISVAASGERCKLRDDTAEAIAGNEPQDGWSARTVQPLFTRIIAEGLGGSLRADPKPEEISLVATGLSAEG
ncbi:MULTISPECIES: histidine phosphotransferase family protein [Henriciella]|jgi:histidine phosphotransferase ChpT|uniref:Histidine phosphotransferase n=1 Tax=Henriciella pelagia TaxID=1977912 RepID=A0ABQ1JJT7_9PROT|nr:histidine phosphotransferase family protein [Henriciella pelagia]GGB70795.1 histidine phosphotransferase [Henriciella pelagia]